MKSLFKPLYVLLFAATLFCQAFVFDALALAPLPHYEQICKSLSRRLQYEHLLGVPLDDNISSRAWSNYVAVLDYDRSYFLAADITRFRAYEDKLDDMLRDGDMRFAFEMFEVYKERLRDRTAYVETLLAEGFELDRDEHFLLKRWEHDVPWPATPDIRDDLWRKRIKNEYIRVVLAREGDDDAGDSDASVETFTVTNAVITNLVLNAPIPTNASDLVAASTNAPAADVLPSPEESIIKRYRQSLTILEDSDAEWVLQNYLNAVTQAFDPHSGFMSASVAEDFQIEMSLSLYGIGAMLRAEDGAAKIVRLIPGGPADRDTSENKLQPGDKIVAVAQGNAEPVDIIHWPLHKTVRLIRGEMGSLVVLTVVPSSDPTGATTKTVRLVRDEVKLDGQAAKSDVYTVPNSNGESNTIGVIRLPAFYANMKVASVNHPDYRSASHDVAGLIADLRSTNNIDGLVLDLRNNGGGSLLEAVQMSGLFIPHGPVVQIKARGRHARVLRDRDHGIAYDGPMIVLVNRLSASASEILAGALQDYGRALIVGDTKTHGKGTVQTVLDLGRDDKLGQLKVTTASYHRINGASTQLNGIKADIVLSSPWDFTETGEEYLRNPLPWSRLAPASYAQLMDLAPVVERVRLSSQRRRLSNERYKAYINLLRRVADVTRRDTYTLNIDKRRELNESEEKLADMSEALMDEESNNAAEENGEALKKDLVLRETLNILADAVMLYDALNARQQPAGDPGVSTGDPLIDWLRSGK